MRPRRRRLLQFSSCLLAAALALGPYALAEGSRDILPDLPVPVDFQAPRLQVLEPPATASQGIPPLPQGIGARDMGAQAAWSWERSGPPPGMTSERRSAAVAQVRAVREALRRDLTAMAREPWADKKLLERIGLDYADSLMALEARAQAGDLDPEVRIRLLRPEHLPRLSDYPLLPFDNQPAPVYDRALNIAIFGSSANPPTHGHLAIMLRSLALGADLIVYRPANDDTARKPDLTAGRLRFPMAAAAAGLLAPFVHVAPLAWGTDEDAETHTFDLLAANPNQHINLLYLYGGDHHNAKTASGADDTVYKLQAKLADPNSGHVPGLHSVAGGLFDRGGIADFARTLTVFYLDNVGFHASSTDIRNGRHTLLPHAVIRWIRENSLSLWGIQPR
ncbi:MAG: hypothetical protein KGO96_11495 [Elusimicrobia bacterium]|nr:hypothetical protein [Elusimicrobiota bacterium]MDE2236912.1 hypothetical protein [Elusimicrobiota bacterium]MDE2426517.1 hypothetical protein [Elusimicrobiota bacterium]